MLALLAGSSGFTLSPTAVPQRHARVSVTGVVMQTMSDMRFFVSHCEARTALATRGSQRLPLSLGCTVTV